MLARHTGIPITEAYFHKSWYCVIFHFASVNKGACTSVSVVLVLQSYITQVLRILFIIPSWIIMNGFFPLVVKG